MKRFNISGFASSGAFTQAVDAVRGLSIIYPNKISLNFQSFETRDEFMAWLEAHRAELNAPEHKTSPLVWLDENTFLGGCDETLAWCRSFLSSPSNLAQDSMNAPVDASAAATAQMEEDHGFDYDLVVIGGGSGGLACSKEAKALGANKVAVLDFVKPSSHGSKWGLGGTCVNVGCIPKKLMHTAALLGEHLHDAAHYGWSNATAPAEGAVGAVTAVHSWEVLREKVQDHIKGLNFGYRVQLREKGVTYLNHLGRFTGPNTLHCIDSKGKSHTITAKNVVVAVGGRPQPLDCPGGELAITSDDLFMLTSPPGRTCVVGAGYVALECAGFITGLHQGEVVVLVRSMLLRGFDRDLVERVQAAMVANGTQIITGVLPTSIVKLPSGKLLVSYSNGESGEFDTVLCAIGRQADTAGLGLESVGARVNPKNGKLICVDEATSVPGIYAVGDVVHGVPELTPSAILAGKLLARRLYGGSSVRMDYRNIATTVFTPLEFGTVGYNEEDAIAEFGADQVDCFLSQFSPLEWTIVEKPHEVSCYAKVVVHTGQQNRVLGLHIAAPNAGEIIQGFALAVRKGITHQDLLETVGIHPTTAEEFTTMTISKSSGVSVAKSGC